MKHRSRAFARVSSDSDGNGLDHLTPYIARIHPLYVVALRTSEHCVPLNREVTP
jgi:hypothetical protein